MSRTHHRRWLAALAVLAVIAAAATVFVAQRLGGPDSRLGQAMEFAPDDAVRFGWTDWAGVRTAVDADVSASSPAREVDAFLGAAFDADLSSMSALVQSAPTLQTEYGVSPASLEWELLAQSTSGAVVVMGLPEELDLGELTTRFASLGYAEPDAEDGVWDGGPQLLPEIGSLTPELAYLSLDAEERVLYASDEAATLRDLDGAQRGDTDVDAEDSPDGTAGGIAAAVQALGEVTSAAVYSGDHACGALAMTQADAADQSEAASLIGAAGDVHAYEAFAIGARADQGEDGRDDGRDGERGEIRVAMAFEDDERARADADSRSRLAAGAAPGQGGTFPERFALGDVIADGRVLTMQLLPEERTYVLSDMANGPVLFATC